MDINTSVSCSFFAYLPLPTDISFCNLSLTLLLDRCSRFPTSVLIFTAFSINNILVIFPVSFAVLYLGFQRWRQQCSISTAAATSHSDILTYNMVAMLLIEVSGSALYCVGGYANIVEIILFFNDFFCTVWSMKMQFHMLTCVERYLAVVHPVTYLGLKNKNGIRIRKISIACVWLQFFLWVGLVPITSAHVNLIVFFSHLVIAFIVISFCSLSVLCALRRPGPGEVGGDREQVAQAKQRAFHTITAIMGTLLLSLAGVLVCAAIYASSVLNYSDSCAVMCSFVLFSLPSSLVVPLLYLHRTRKLPQSNHTNESG